MSTTQTASNHISQIIVFDTCGFYRHFPSWIEAADFLGMKKHDFYFALNNGTPIATHGGEFFVDIYITPYERARIAGKPRKRKAKNSGKEVAQP